MHEMDENAKIVRFGSHTKRIEVRKGQNQGVGLI